MKCEGHDVEMRSFILFYFFGGGRGDFIIYHNTAVFLRINEVNKEWFVTTVEMEMLKVTYKLKLKVTETCFTSVRV